MSPPCSRIGWMWIWRIWSNESVLAHDRDWNWIFKDPSNITHSMILSLLWLHRNLPECGWRQDQEFTIRTSILLKTYILPPFFCSLPTVRTLVLMGGRHYIWMPQKHCMYVRFLFGLDNLLISHCNLCAERRPKIRIIIIIPSSPWSLRLWILVLALSSLQLFTRSGSNQRFFLKQ